MKSYKDIIQQIKKAQAVPMPSSGKAKDPSFTKAPGVAIPSGGSNHQRSVSHNSSPVRVMQQTILEVANIASNVNLSSFEISSKDNGEEQMQENSFGQFMVNTFINPKEDSNENKSLQGIIDSIKNIGTPGVNGGMATADGVWKSKTQDSLKNLYLLTAGFLDFSASMKLPVQGYNISNLNKLNNLIAAGYPKLKTTQETDALAQAIIAHLNALKVFFTNFNKEINNNPKLKNQFSGRKSLSKYKAVPMKNEVPEGYETDHVNLNLPNMKKQLQLSDLEDIPHFKNWMEENGNKTDEVNLRQMLKVIKDQLQ